MGDGEDAGSMVLDALIGAAAGAAAVWAMDRPDWFAFRNEDSRARKRTQAVRPGGMDPGHVGASKAAEALGQELEPHDNNAAGKAVHYSIGVVPGAIYGAMRHKAPVLTKGGGTLFGLGLFFAQDEGLNAIAGLSARPQQYPWQAHARGFVAHAVYGLVLHAVLSLTDRWRGR